MPLSLLSGDAWDESRKLLAKSYSNLILVSIAAARDDELSFSADTGMGECLVSGRKADGGSARAVFVILNERPKFPMVGATTAAEIRRIIAHGNLRRLEDGPVGGTVLRFGNDVVGHALSAPLPAAGGWHISRIADLALAQTAYHPANGRIWLPSTTRAESRAIPITTVKQIGVIGPYHADVNWTNANGTVRGPLDIMDVRPGSAPTYPVLWKHSAKRERTLAFEAESEGQPKKGRDADEQELIDKKVPVIWATASHCHFSREFRFNTQSTGIQYTPRLAIGGRSWISIKMESNVQEKALTAWGNTSFGLLLHWWHANKQQSGRGSIGKTALQDLPVLDVPALPQNRLSIAARIFDEISDKPLRPANEIDQDPVRRELDERFGREVMDLPASLFGSGGAVELLRQKLAREPSIHGGK